MCDGVSHKTGISSGFSFLYFDNKIVNTIKFNFAIKKDCKMQGSVIYYIHKGKRGDLMDLLNTMSYKDYLAVLEYSDHERAFVGRVFGIKSIPKFSACTVDELEKVFHESVDRYIAECKRKGTQPEISYRGTITIRIKPKLHRTVALYAWTQGDSVNGIIEQALEEFLEEHTDQDFQKICGDLK